MEYDVIIIGSGPGGYVAAIRAAQLGKKVAVVERDELGGVCLNWGCIPTKALLKSAHVYADVSRASSYGVEISGTVKPDMGKMVTRSREIAAIMSNGVDFLMKKNGIEIVRGVGRLLGGGLVGVTSDEGGRELQAPHIILATGARQREIPALPVDGRYVLNSSQAITLTRLPESVVVVGSGAIGCEFAYYFATLGSKVTLVEYLPRIMPTADEEVSRYMDRSFRKMRVSVMAGTEVKGVTVEEGKCHVETENNKGLKSTEASIVISAVGIKSNIENIGAEELGLAIEKDRVLVDEFYRTNVPGVYAIGDIVPGPALAHVASAEGVCCVEKICGLDPVPVDYSAIPACVYISPEAASVGITEQEALASGRQIRIGRFPLTALGRSTAEGERDGFAKLIFDAHSEKLLGAHLVGMNVTEMIAETTLAQKLGVTSHTLARIIHPHPTISEAIMEAAEDAIGQAIHL